jgi:hypothetical protein
MFNSGLVPRKIRMLAEEYQVSLPRSKLLTKEKQRNVKTLLKEYYGSLVKHVMKVRIISMITELTFAVRVVCLPLSHIFLIGMVHWHVTLSILHYGNHHIYKWAEHILGFLIAR